MLSRTRWLWALLFVAAGAAGGCTLSPGEWFLKLRPTFEGSYVRRADRDAGEGWQRLNTLYEVQVTRAEVLIENIELQESAVPEGGGGSGAATFDPANPPDGYSLCHNGHCHAADGALVPYAQIAAELVGGAAGAPRTVVVLPVGATDLLLRQRRALPCQPGCALGQANIGRARATVTAVVFEGLVRDGAVPSRLATDQAAVVPWRWQAGAMQSDGVDGGDAAGTLQAVALDCPVDLPGNNTQPPNVSLDLTLQTGARLLDDVEWGELTADLGIIDLSAPANAAAAERLRDHLAESALAAAIQRTD